MEGDSQAEPKGEGGGTDRDITPRAAHGVVWASCQMFCVKDESRVTGCRGQSRWATGTASNG